MTLAPGQPVLVSESAETTISISWSVPSGSVVEQYEVEWSSHQCPNGPVEGNTTLTGATTNFTMQELRAGTEYNVSVTPINSAGNFTSDILNIHTLEMGEYIAGNYALVFISASPIDVQNSFVIYRHYRANSLCIIIAAKNCCMQLCYSSICSTIFCECERCDCLHHRCPVGDGTMHCTKWRDNRPHSLLLGDRVWK